MVEILIRIGNLKRHGISSASSKRTRKGCSLMQELAAETVKREENMTLQRRGLLLVVTLAAAAATPAFGQAVVPTVGSADSGGESAASIPDFSGIWVHGSIRGCPGGC